jgi:hypothetical protein
MEDWIVAIFLEDGTRVCELTVAAENRMGALTAAVHQAHRNGIDADTIYYTSVELADESRRIYTGGCTYVELLPTRGAVMDAQASL